MADQNDTRKQNIEESEKNGRLAGAGAGVLAGAQLGTVLLPIPIVGTFTGCSGWRYARSEVRKEDRRNGPRQSESIQSVTSRYQR